MENIKDWCISRQLWWGHRIPVWYRGDEIYCGLSKPSGDDWIQDSDVLDTWFSSWLWPFATLGWPDDTDDMKKFYPTQDLVTGPDIIFFWVARMIMAGMYFCKDIPFSNVCFTGIIRDAEGRKMKTTISSIELLTLALYRTNRQLKNFLFFYASDLKYSTATVDKFGRYPVHILSWDG